MILALLAQNEHGRSLIALIRAIRGCPACFPELYITCPEHQAELDRLYPEGCTDPECPACKSVTPPATPINCAGCLAEHHGIGPVPHDTCERAARTRETVSYGDDDGTMTTEPLHDNGDYHDR